MDKITIPEIAEVTPLPNLKSRVNARFRTLSLLSEYFPITLDNGMEVPGVVARCSHCDKPIMRAMLRGELRHAPGGCYRVTGIGWCLDCDVLSPYLFHVVPWGPSFILRNMCQRGWVETYQPKVLDFKKPPPEIFICEAANTSA